MLLFFFCIDLNKIFHLFLVCWWFVNWRYSKEDDSGSIKSKTNNCIKIKNKTFPLLFFSIYSINRHIYIMLSARSFFFFLKFLIYIYTYILCTDIFQWIFFVFCYFFLQLCLLNLAVFFFFFFFRVRVCVSSGQKKTVSLIHIIIILCCVLWCDLVFSVVENFLFFFWVCIISFDWHKEK